MLTQRRSSLRILIWVIAAAGLVDAIAGGVWDLAAVLSVIVLALGVDVAAATRRPTISLRADLAKWIADRAAIESESTAAIASRAVATYRAHLLGSERESPGTTPEDPHAGSGPLESAPLDSGPLDSGPLDSGRSGTRSSDTQPTR